MTNKAVFYDRIYKYFMALLAVFACVVLTISAANIITLSRRVDEQQKQTIKYLRCTSLTPVDKRTPDFVDQCFTR